MAAAGGDWGIVGGRAALARRWSTRWPRRTCCTAWSRSRARRRAPGWSASLVPASGTCRATPDAVVALLADPAIRVVTLTVTEKAYRLDPAGRLLDDPDCGRIWRRDCRLGRCPACWSAALRQRAAAGGARSPWSAATTCRRTAHVCASVLRAGTRTMPGRTGCPFPGTMVDRIVPATHPGHAGARRGSRSACRRPGRGRGRAVPAVGHRGRRSPAAARPGTRPARCSPPT